MVVLKLADEVYELQGWEPPTKKPEIATQNRSANKVTPSAPPPGNSYRKKGADTRK
jgi:hypothetical protein